MDVTSTIEPRSDQINADDLIGGPQTYTITKVARGGAEQPLDISLAETARFYRPSKSMRRILVAAWGKEASAWVGQRLTLYRDPSVRFGKEEVGGIKISHMSGLDRPLTVALTVTRGKRAPHTVQPLPDDAPPASSEPTAEQVAACADVEQLRAMYRASSSDDRKTQITSRVAELSAPALPEGEAR